MRENEIAIDTDPTHKVWFYDTGNVLCCAGWKSALAVIRARYPNAHVNPRPFEETMDLDRLDSEVHCIAVSHGGYEHFFFQSGAEEDASDPVGSVIIDPESYTPDGLAIALKD